MFTGDSLAILSLLVGTMMGAIIGAIPLEPGRKRNVLWVIAVFFGLLALGWVAAPVASPAVQVARNVVAAVVQSGAFVMVGTVAIVALMISRRRPDTTPQAVPVASPEAEATGAAPDRRQLQRVIYSLQGAKEDAGVAIANATSDNRKRAAEKALPQMKAALLSANKAYGIPMPPEIENPVFDLELDRRLIEKVLPFLREGHIDEARQQAEAFIARIDQTAAP